MKREAETTWAAERVENALLRERINDVAAEVARLTAALEGPGSPIEAMLAAAVPGLDRGRAVRRQRQAADRAPRSMHRSKTKARSPTASAPCSPAPRARRRTEDTSRESDATAQCRQTASSDWLPRHATASLDTRRAAPYIAAPIGPGA